MERLYSSDLKRRRHERILQAAGALFAEKGYPEVSFEQIAKEADVARRTLYNHFHDKSALYDTLIDHILTVANQMSIDYAEMYQSNLDAAIQLCLDLWITFGVTLKIIHQTAWENRRNLEEKHKKFLTAFTYLLTEYKGQSGDSSTQLPAEKRALLLYRIFIPVLETLGARKDRDEMFYTMMRALLTA